ncbi:MAG: hypothetical protein V7736_09235 [Colwellia polaris]|jgi:hypothetical protein
MISAKFKELNYDLLNKNDYEIYFTDECIKLVKINSEDAWKSISKYTKNQPELLWNQGTEEDNDDAIFMASASNGKVTILNFKEKVYTQSNEFISFFQWLKNYYQLLQDLMPIGVKYNILALTIHSQLPIAEECYEDILEEDEVLYESDRLMRCPIARQAALKLDGMLVRYLFDDLTLDERALAVDCDPMAIALFHDATSEERLSAIQKHPFIICDLEAITFKELTLAFNTISEDGVKLTLVPFKQTTKNNQLLSIKDKAAFIKRISANNMPDSITFDINNSLVFCFS